MDLELKGKLALISGSTAGIGLAIATTLAREGARVIVNGRSQASVDDVVTRLKSTTGGSVQGFAGDLSKAASAEEIARQHPGVEILVNNLGIFEPKPFEEIPDNDWVRFFEVNVLSGVRLARLYLPAMKRANWGRDHIHLQRKRDPNSTRNDPLRHDENRTTGRLTWLGRSGCRLRHHGQQHFAGSNEISWSCRLRRRTYKVRGKVV